MKEIVQNKEAKKVLENYFRMLRSNISVLPPKESEDIYLEIKSHIYESIRNEHNTDELNATLNAINSFGEPDDYLEPLIDQKLSQAASRTLNPTAVLKSFLFKKNKSFARYLMIVIFSLFYTLSVLLLIVAVVKIFYSPAGVYIHSDGQILLGYSNEPDAREILGYWIIPIAIFLSFLNYYIITKSIKIIK